MSNLSKFVYSSFGAIVGIFLVGLTTIAVLSANAKDPSSDFYGPNEREQCFEDDGVWVNEPQWGLRCIPEESIVSPDSEDESDSTPDFSADDWTYEFESYSIHIPEPTIELPSGQIVYGDTRAAVIHFKDMTPPIDRWIVIHGGKFYRFEELNLYGESSVEGGTIDFRAIPYFEELGDPADIKVK